MPTNEMNNRQDEIHLIKLCQEGDPVAFERLYQRYSRDVYSMALRMVHSEEIAEEVTQEVFISVYRNIQRFQFQSAFTTWLYRIVYRRMADYFRKAKKHTQKRISMDDPASIETVMQLQDQAPLPSEQTEAAERRAGIEKMIESLGPKHRMIILLRYIQQCSYEEMAEVLQCRIGTVKSRLNRAHKFLEEKLRDIML